MKKKFLFLFLFLFIFFLGIEVGVRKSFPYPQLKQIKVQLIGKNRVHSTLYYYQKLLYEFFCFNKEYKIVMLGDSITSQVNWNNLAHRNDVLNRGISGDNTDGLLEKLNTIPNDVDKAFIMIGINDLGKGSSVEHIFFNYVKIITVLKKRNIVPIMQSTLYIVKDEGNRKNKDVQKLNDLLMNYAKHNNIRYINLNKYMSQNNHLCKHYSLDGIHLNNIGYKIWISVIKKYF